MRIKKTKIPIYKIRMTLIESSNKEKVVKYFKRMDFDFECEDIFAHIIEYHRKENNKKYYCIYLVFNRENKHSKITHGVIAHEVVHATDAIFHYIEEEKTEECYAYLVEYLINMICEFLEIDNIISTTKE